MARETRSQTGNAKPRVIPVIDTAPTIKRKPATKQAATKTEAKAAKPAGVTKKKAPKKETSAAKKVKAAVKKTAKKVGATEKKGEEKAEEKAEKLTVNLGGQAQDNDEEERCRCRQVMTAYQLYFTAKL
ncbi:hypothetical protein N657DRAFT_202668 [Parathielavia appendiculata]|uniref:Uncharacterized protein n=1 Tax=Parathielavia appendiculata TaxID=2587402 RepID=A0AAN6U7G8_9PEZI|nr:hypothetical protein N657DRAFT_202668 [Parathielavia appendiculata]